MTTDHQPPIHALSTMWSQGRFPHHNRDSMVQFAEAASRLGYPAVEINYVIPPKASRSCSPPITSPSSPSTRPPLV